jgi:hypothetical protein
MFILFNCYFDNIADDTPAEVESFSRYLREHKQRQEQKRQKTASRPSEPS